eukprot:COSAG01_NODE_1369_length_10552_cov_5.204535_11_plen_196_part_00
MKTVEAQLRTALQEAGQRTEEVRWRCALSGGASLVLDLGSLLMVALTVEAEVARKLVVALLKAANFKQAVVVGGQYLALVTELQQDEERLEALAQLGAGLLGAGQAAEALATHSTQLELARSCGDAAQEENAACGLGSACLAMGDYRPAAMWLSAALQVASDRSCWEGMVKALLGLGRVGLGSGNYTEAQRYFIL